MVQFKLLACKGWIIEETPAVCSLEEVISLCFYSQKNFLKPVSYLSTPVRTAQEEAPGFLYSIMRTLCLWFIACE